MMTEEFVSNFANAVEVEPGTINESTVFKEIETWDSLCVLSVIAMIDEAYQVTLGGDDIESCKTILDIITLVETRR